MNVKNNIFNLLILFFCFLFLIISWYTKIFVFILISVLFSNLFLIRFLKYKRFFLFIISFLLSTIFAEIIYPYIPLNSNKMSSAYFDDNSSYANQNYRDYIKGLGFVPREGLHDSKKLSSDGEIIYDVIYNIGKDNFRKNLFDGKASIHLFGGSFAFGEGLNDNQTLAYYLWDRHKLKTKNFGVHGYGLHQALFLIEELNKSSINGINLILTGSFHLRRSACKVSYSNGTPYYENSNGYAILNGICNLKDSFVVKVLNKSNLSKLYYKIFTRYGKNNDEDILRYFSILRTIKKYSKLNNSTLIIAYIATDESNFKNTSYTNEKFYLELSKIPDKIVNVTLAENSTKIQRKYYIHPLDRHPSALANKERAKILAEIIKN